jgi:hypothetical protein
MLWLKVKGLRPEGGLDDAREIAREREIDRQTDRQTEIERER